MILYESFQVYVWNIPDIYHAYSFRVIWYYAWNIPGLFLCLRIGPGLQQQCDWDATAVTVHVFWVSRVFNIQRQTWQARMTMPERQMQPYVAQHRL